MIALNNHQTIKAITRRFNAYSSKKNHLKLTVQQSQAVQVGNHIFVSGQIPADKNGNLVEGSIADKTKASCEGMKAILEEAGSSIDKVIKVIHISILSAHQPIQPS